MAVKLTDKPSLSTEPQGTTDEASAELKSSFNSGLEAEALVAQKYLKLGYKIIRQRWKTPFAEVDLLFSFPREPQRLLLLEVKKRRSLEFQWTAVGKKQKLRLQRALIWLAESGYQVEARLVFVCKDRQVEYPFDSF